METSKAPLLSTPPGYYYNDSTGYLEDALIEFSIRFKRQRLLPQNCLCPSSFGYSSDFGSDFNFWTGSCSFHPEEEISRTTNLQCFSETKSIEEGMSIPTKALNSSPPRYTRDSVGLNYDERSFSTDSSSVSAECSRICGNTYQGEDVKSSDEKEDKRTRMTRVLAYPFAMVKPGSIDGDLTLEDINKRIMMPPTRPVRHPVGEYACHPCVVSPHGPGLSGKAVVALTRIHTQGRGTITIIRTKG